MSESTIMYQRCILVRTTTPTVHRRCQLMYKQHAKVRNEVPHRMCKSWTCKNIVLTSRLTFLLKRAEIWVFAHTTSLRNAFAVVRTYTSRMIFAYCFKHFDVVFAICGPWCTNVFVMNTALLISPWRSGSVGETDVHFGQSWWVGRKYLSAMWGCRATYKV